MVGVVAENMGNVRILAHQVIERLRTGAAGGGKLLAHLLHHFVSLPGDVFVGNGKHLLKVPLDGSFNGMVALNGFEV